MVSVRRIEPGDAALLRTVRLAALKDAPSAFGSTHAAEAVRSDHEWTERALAGSRYLYAPCSSPTSQVSLSV